MSASSPPQSWSFGCLVLDCVLLLNRFLRQARARNLRFDGRFYRTLRATNRSVTFFHGFRGAVMMTPR